jgi:hypothetical protein
MVDQTLAEGDADSKSVLSTNLVVQLSAAAGESMAEDIAALHIGRASNAVDWTPLAASDFASIPVVFAEPVSPELSAKRCARLLVPGVLSVLSWAEIGQLHCVSAAARRLCEDPAIAPGLWMAACMRLESRNLLATRVSGVTFSTFFKVCFEV